MRITVRHHFDFGHDRNLVGDDLVRREAWDALRTGTDGPFALPATVDKWHRLVEDRPEIEQRARRIDTWLEERGVRSLASYGAGAAHLEYWLNRLRPSRDLVLTDYASETVERLRTVFPEAEVVRHDLLADPPVDNVDMHLFHRIDTEFTNREWHRILRRFAAVPLLVVATELIDWRRALDEVRKGFRPGFTRAGWVRTRDAFEGLWPATHRATALRFHDLEAWSLDPLLTSADR